MKKFLTLFILLFSLLGCTNMQVGQTVEKDNITYLKVTDSDVFLLKDNITLEKYYSVSAISVETNFVLDTSKQILLELRYYPEEKSLNLLFPLYKDGASNIIKEITFSNKEIVMNAKISNLSNVISSAIPNIHLNAKQARSLYDLMINDKPIILRVLSSEGYFDISFKNENKKGFADLLEIYLGLKKYNN